MKRFIALAVASVVSAALATNTITGAGATFPAILYGQMFAEYAKRTGVQVNYDASGSGAGQKRILERAVDFGASDAFLTDEQLKSAPGKVLHVPTALGAVVPVYNLPGLTQPLRFDGLLLADIFLGKVTRWNDPAIAKLNPGVTLPDTRITVATRSDGSGTTAVFVDFLSKISSDWASQVSKGPQTQVRWPTGAAMPGNGGVASLVKQAPGTIGYVEVSYAKQGNLSYGLVRNASGKFIDAGDIKSVEAAAAASPLPADTRVSLTNAGGNAYPISGFTWLLVYQEQQYGDRTAEQAKALFDLLWWMTHDGQKLNESLGYGALPAAAVQRAAALIESMSFGGAKLRP
jgi:phosphate transport system substrate-binding protein